MGHAEVEFTFVGDSSVCKTRSTGAVVTRLTPMHLPRCSERACCTVPLSPTDLRHVALGVPALERSPNRKCSRSGSRIRPWANGFPSERSESAQRLRRSARNDCGQSLKLMCPSNDPVEVDLAVAKSMTPILRSVNVPVAPANRPLPPTIVRTSVKLTTVGSRPTAAMPANVVCSWSPFAATKS